MKAMVLAAGLGTRLKPLTDALPKALLRVGPYTLLEFAIRKLKSAGFNQLIINVHHKASQIEEYLLENNNFGCEISISDERAQLLDTGGGIKKAAWFFDDDQSFIVYNADIVCDLDIHTVYKEHLADGSLATLVVRQRDTTRYLLFDETLRLCGWENRATGERKLPLPNADLEAFAFSGIHVLSPKIFKLMPAKERFSIIETYLDHAQNQLIKGYLDRNNTWADAGKPESLKQAALIAESITLPE